MSMSIPENDAGVLSLDVRLARVEERMTAAADAAKVFRDGASERMERIEHAVEAISKKLDDVAQDIATAKGVVSGARWTSRIAWGVLVGCAGVAGWIVRHLVK